MPLTNSNNKLRTIQLTAVIFFTVSGGPYGLEPLLNYAGENGAIFLLMITPLLWDIPALLMVLELNSMMPVTGGYYQWVKKAAGLKWAFMEGWWTWLYTFVDLAIYPVLFVVYASYLLPGLEGYKIPICLCIIWMSALINIWGIVPVGKISIVLGIAVLIPFLLLFIKAFMVSIPSMPSLAIRGKPFSSVGMGLFTIMWNFIGWDSATTYAGEVNKPVKTYIFSLAAAFVLIFIFYFITILISINSGISATQLSDKGFPLLGKVFGGSLLGQMIAIGGMASSLGLYSAVLLSVSRVPEVMAADGLLPEKLKQIHPKYNTPYFSIICCSVVVTFMVFWAFEELVIIDITVYGAALMLEFMALILLRQKFPEDERPFRIPLKNPFLWVLVLLPALVYFIAIISAFSQSEKTLISLVFALLALSSGQLIWFLVNKNKG